jgi:kumamolisin
MPEVVVTAPPPEAPRPRELTPTPVPDGLAPPNPALGRKDLGPAPDDMRLRGLIAFPIRDEAGLEATLRQLYEPSSPTFRRYLTPDEWNARHAPAEEDVREVSEWLESQGMQVARVATNRLLLQFTGTVAQFNAAFNAGLRVVERPSAQAGGGDPHQTVGVTRPLDVPRFIAERIASVVAADIAVSTTQTLPAELPSPPPVLPSPLDAALTPEQVSHAYNLDALHSRGFRGQGVRLGIVVGAQFRVQDMEDFWNMFGTPRALPRVVQTQEAPVTRYREVALNTQWAGAMAPEAEVLLYMGPDARITSILYSFNEAVGRGEVSVISSSFARREDGEPRAVHEAYARSAMMGAALGISVVVAGGNSGDVDTPSSSPYATSVGGTELFMDGLRREREQAWYYSGSGISRTFRTPWWQQGVNPPAYWGGQSGLRGMRGTSDLALNAGRYYWFTFLGVTVPNTGTSFAAPVFAGMVASLNSARAAEGKPPVGWLNSHLYTLPEVQESFRDITTGGTDKYPAGPGWDFPTGWGAPDMEGLLRTLP